MYEPLLGIELVLPGNSVCYPGCAGVEPSCVAVFSAAVGASVEENIGVRNTSFAEDLVLDAVELADGTDPSFAIVDAPDVVAAGETGVVRVRYAPTAAATHEGTLFIDSNGITTVDGNVELPLRGDATE